MVRRRGDDAQAGHFLSERRTMTNRRHDTASHLRRNRASEKGRAHPQQGCPASRPLGALWAIPTRPMIPRAGEAVNDAALARRMFHVSILTRPADRVQLTLRLESPTPPDLTPPYPTRPHPKASPYQT